MDLAHYDCSTEAHSMSVGKSNDETKIVYNYKPGAHMTL